MCIQVSFGHSDEELATAGWAAVEAVEQAGYSLPESQAAKALQHTLRIARWQTSTPQQWATALITSLAQVFGQLERAQDTVRDLKHVQNQLDYYQRLADQHARDPLQAQVNKLTGERDHWQAEAERLTQRIKTLEGALTQAQQAHREEADRLRADIAGLNRIVREQQDQINNAASL